MNRFKTVGELKEWLAERPDTMPLVIQHSGKRFDVHGAVFPLYLPENTHSDACYSHHINHKVFPRDAKRGDGLITEVVILF